MAYAALLSVVQLLDQITHEEYFCNLSTIKQRIRILHEKFCFLQAFLEDDPPKGDDATDCLESQIRETAYKTEDIFELLIQNQTNPGVESSASGRVKRVYWRKVFAVKSVISLQNQRGENTDLSVAEKLYQDVQRAVDEVDSIVREVEMIKESRKVESLQSSNPTAADPGSQRVAPGERTTMVGSDEDLMKIKEQLCGGSSNLQIIPIVGMGGIGKTALASNVFYDSCIDEYFHIRAWTTITQDHKVPDVILGLLFSMNRTSVNCGRRVGELSELLYKSLKGRKYLVVLDDIWSTEAWDDLKMLFPDDRNGSRIVLTTRLVDLAVYPNSSGLYHQMQFLNDEQSWNLLRVKVFGEGCPPELEETGKLIARNCRGLPLSIILVAGVLSKMKRIKYQWDNIARDVSVTVATSEEQISSKILSLSYNHLPHHLKPCFLYLGGFPEDYEIPVFELINLWVAEGFLKVKGSQCLEEAGEEYFEDLVRRSLVLVTKKRSNGKPRCCSMHDLLREMCIDKARDEKFIHPMNGIQESIELKRRLCFSKSVEWFHFKNAYTSSVVRSIFCCSYNERVLSGFNRLKVLHIIEVHFDSFPLEILQLSRLKFLAFTSGFIRYCTIPTAMPKLRHLQTFIVGSSVKFKTSEHRLVAPLPIWKMPQIRHLVFFSITLSPASFPATYDEDIPALENLQTLSRIRNFRFTKEAIKMMPNLKKLKVLYTGGKSHDLMSEYELNNLVHLHQLETLDLIFQPSLLTKLVTLRFEVPHKLKSLTLKGCGLSWKDMTNISSLPYLEVLKLLHLSVSGEEWEPVEGEFLRLRFLLMQGLNLEHWMAESVHFPSLEYLIIKHCLLLESIPSGIGEIATLRMIEVECSELSSLAESAERILEEQQDMGNEALQVRVGVTNTNSSSCRLKLLEQMFS